MTEHGSIYPDIEDRRPHACQKEENALQETAPGRLLYHLVAEGVAVENILLEFGHDANILLYL